MFSVTKTHNLTITNYLTNQIQAIMEEKIMQILIGGWKEVAERGQRGIFSLSAYRVTLFDQTFSICV